VVCWGDGMAIVYYKRKRYTTLCDREYLDLSNEIWDDIIRYYERNNLIVPSEEQLILEHEEALERVVNYDDYCRDE
jgi:hypothetical protein